MEKRHLGLISDLSPEQPQETATVAQPEQVMPDQRVIERNEDTATEDPYAGLRQKVLEARQTMMDTPFNPETGEGADARRAYGLAIEALRSAELGEPEGAFIISLRRPS